jgi:hypothetical protein
MVNKSAGVTEKLMTILTQFGPPKILQSDNGHELVANVTTVKKYMDGFSNHSCASNVSTVTRLY